MTPLSEHHSTENSEESQIGSSVTLEKSSIKRDGPVFFSSDPVKVARRLRGMKKSIYTLRPGAMGPEDGATVAGLLNNGVHGAPAFWFYSVPLRLCGQSAFVSTRGSKTSVLKGFKVI